MRKVCCACACSGRKSLGGPKTPGSLHVSPAPSSSRVQQSWPDWCRVPPLPRPSDRQPGPPFEHSSGPQQAGRNRDRDRENRNRALADNGAWQPTKRVLLCQMQNRALIRYRYATGTTLQSSLPDSITQATQAYQGCWLPGLAFPLSFGAFSSVWSVIKSSSPVVRSGLAIFLQSFAVLLLLLLLLLCSSR